MTTEDELLKAYEELRRAELGYRGACGVVAEALGEFQSAKRNLERLIKNAPNRIESE